MISPAAPEVKVVLTLEGPGATIKTPFEAPSNCGSNQRSRGVNRAITTYALWRFTHFGSIAILIGGIGTLVPEKKPVVSKLALKGLVAGFLATVMTASIAGVFL